MSSTDSTAIVKGKIRITRVKRVERHFIHGSIGATLCQHMSYGIASRCSNRLGVYSPTNSRRRVSMGIESSGRSGISSGASFSTMKSLLRPCSILRNHSA